VTAAAATSQLPLEGFGIAFAYSVTGREVPPSERPTGDFRVVSPGYFETMGIRLLRGRTFDGRDRRDAAPVVVIDQALARTMFGADDPVGRSITIAYGRDQVPRQIVGVVSDVRQRALNVPVQPGYYLPLTQVSWSMARIVVRTDLPPASLGDAMRRELAAMDALIPALNVATLDDLAAQSVAVPRFNMLLVGVFAAIALLLATSGVYSVMSYAVTQRTREIGVRMALGARAEQVRSSVWRRGLLLGVVGGAIGLGLAFVIAPQMTTLLYDVDVHDFQSFAVPPLLFLVAAWVGSYLPARRASRLDPMEALRAD
jgi:predicted permease